MGAAATAVGYIILPALCVLMTCWASKMEMRMEGGAGWRGNTMLYEERDLWGRVGVCGALC